MTKRKHEEAPQDHPNNLPWPKFNNIFSFHKELNEDKLTEEQIKNALEKYPEFATNQTLAIAIVKNNLWLVNWLITQKPNLFIQRVNLGNEPIHLAAAKGREEIVELLINNGADVNTQGQYN